MSKQEERMARAGVERYRKNSRASRAKRVETAMPSVRGLMYQSIQPLTEAIKSFLEDPKKGKSRADQRIFQGLSMLPPQDTAYLALRVVLDCLHSQPTLTQTAGAVGRLFFDEVSFRTAKDANPNRVNFARAYTIKRLRSSRGRKALQRYILEYRQITRENGLSSRTIIELGAWLIARIAETLGVVEVRTLADKFTSRRSVRLCATDKTLYWINKQDEERENLRPLHLPITEPPRDWSPGSMGGYHTAVLRMSQRNPEQSHNRSGGETGYPGETAYAALNYIQQTPYRITRGVYAVLERGIRERIPLSCLPAFAERVLFPSKPEGVRMDDPVFREWKRNVAQLYAVQRGRVTAAMVTHRVAGVAKDYLDIERFWYPWSLDFRGRMYPDCHWLQPQQADMTRGMLEFAEGAPIGPEDSPAWKAWAIHGANAWGLDKKLRSERVGWVKDNREWLCAVAADPFAQTDWTKADEPWQMLQFALDFAAWSKDPTGHVSHLPVRVDCSNNGLQLYSLLTRDEGLARATNVLPTGSYQDIYSRVAEATTAAWLSLRHELRRPECFDTVFAQGIPRELAKRPVMVVPYGGTLHGCKNYVAEWYFARLAEDEKLRPNQATTHELSWLSGLLWKEIQKELGAASPAMCWLQEVARAVSQANLPIRWTSPSGMQCVQKYPKMDAILVKTLCAGRVFHSFLRSEGAVPRSDTTKNAQAFPPNFVHSIDAAIAALAMLRAKEAGIRCVSPIHDSYGTLAAHMPTKELAVRQSFAEVFSEDLFAKLKKELEASTGLELPPLPPHGSLDVSCVLQPDSYLFS